MAENSAIEWCDHTFNPWIGCSKVSPGCDHCYAEARMDTRLHRVQWGPGKPRQRTKTWGDPVRWNKAHEAFFAQHGRRQRVFCASLADVFDNEVPVEWRVDLFDLIRRCENLDFLLLTKRVGNVSRMLGEAREAAYRAGRYDLTPWIGAWQQLSIAPANVWLGVTVVNQEEADRDLLKLLATPARVRFLSIEPMLGPIDLTRVAPEEDTGSDMGGWGEGGPDAYPSWNDVLMGAGWSAARRGQALSGHEISWHFDPIDWVIVGGESGHGARPMHPDWARSLRDQCVAAGVPFLFKQHGAWVSPAEPAFGKVQSRRVILIRPDGRTVDLASAEGRDENIDAVTMSMVGKKAAGRLLDGVEHNGFPGSAP